MNCQYSIHRRKRDSYGLTGRLGDTYTFGENILPILVKMYTGVVVTDGIQNLALKIRFTIRSRFQKKKIDEDSMDPIVSVSIQKYEIRAVWNQG